MAELKPAYLIHGDDQGALAERRAGLRALAEAEPGGGASVELLEGEEATPAGVAQALAAMTLGVGRRVIIVEGVERWRQADVESRLAPAMSAMPPETTLALFAREDARAKAPPAVHQAVVGAGGQVVAQATAKPWELPKWTREQAARMGLSLDAAAAKALVGQVGERQQRLLRELEKLELELGPGARPSAEELERRAAHSAERRVWSLADALVARDGPRAVSLLLALRGQGERLPSLLYWATQRLRLALEVAGRLAGGESQAAVRRGLRMPPKAAERFVSDVAGTEPERLRRALEAIAQLEVDSRGGGTLDEDTAALRALETVCA
jgi:DNA polymerase-3 subunit delta